MQPKSVHGRDLRKGRVSLHNQVYLITIVTRNRQPLFGRLYSGRIVVQAFRYAAESDRAVTLAYVVMPDHVHWLMSLGNRCSLASVVGMMKRHISRRVNEQTDSTRSPVWQRGFHDHALRREEDVVHVARYIVANPLRAGLVSKIGDYPLWDAVWL